MRLFEAAQGLLFRGGGDVYARANRELFAQYEKAHAPDGEITFLAADPALEGQGTGTRLLRSWRGARRQGVLPCTRTTAATSPFTNIAASSAPGERDIVMELNGKRVPLRCFLYRRRL